MSIHDELERIASRAPEVVVPADTWGRAQRARRRQRALVVAVVVVLVALAGSMVWWPSRDGVEPAGSEGLAVPTVLRSVPERMSARENGGSWMREQVTQDVTSVGVGAAAWVTDGGLPVVVDARAGGYHLLDLPDFAGNNEVFVFGLGTPVVALSPDGTRLAYGYAVFGPESAEAPIPSGVRVIDLRTGDLREIPVPGEEGTAVSKIAWSRDGRWLAFAGMREGSWTEFSMGGSTPVLGRIAPGSDRADVRRIHAEGTGLAVDDQGTVRFGDTEIRAWDGERTTRPVEGDPLDLQLGRTADGRMVRLDGPSRSASELVEVPRGRVQVLLDPTIASTLSLATGLMSDARPTVERPEPDWPGEFPWLPQPALWLLVAIVVAAFAIRPLRRLRRALPRTAQSRWLGDESRRTGP